MPKRMVLCPCRALISSTAFITLRDFSNLSSPKSRIGSCSAGASLFSMTPAFLYL